jgi:hypothetical protein
MLVMFVQCCVTTPLVAKSAAVWLKSCYLFVVLGMFCPFDGGQWMLFNHFGDSYAFPMSTGILLGAWAGRLLSSAPTGLPVCDGLVGRASRSGQFKDYRLVGWWRCRLHSLVFWLRSKLSGVMERALLWAEMRESCFVKRVISWYVACSTTLHIYPAAVPFVHRLVIEF